MARKFCRIRDKFTRRAKPIRIIGCPDTQRPDKWSSTVPICLTTQRHIPDDSHLQRSIKFAVGGTWSRLHCTL